MKIIELHHPYSPEKIPNEEVVLVLGFFDGVHKGHQEVIQMGRSIAEKQNLKLALMTFNQHPSIVFQKVDPDKMQYLTSLQQKEALMQKLGVSLLYEVEFTSAFANLAPQEFIDQYVVDLHAKVVVAGFDYTYGKKEQANMTNMPKYAKGRFEVVTVSEKTENGEKISSTRIRNALENGEMEEVTNLLGYPYTFEGTVVHGDARGRTLGYPTANIKVKSTVRLPKEGVYVTEIKVGDRWYPSMGSIGHNDTFGQGRQLTVELFILDFHQDIYGETVAIKWHHFLRDQVAFDHVDGLIRQLKEDEINTADYFLKESDQ